MRTVVYPPPSRFGRTRTVGVVAHPLTALEANALAVDLTYRRRIPVAVSVDRHRVVHLWPWRPVSTADEVTALRTFLAATDARVVWHRPAETC